MKRLILALVTVAALAGCIKMDKTPPKNLPAYVKLYPGSNQVMNLSMAGVTADAVTTTDSPATVMIFYRNQASADGLTESAAPASAGAVAGQEQANFTDASGKMLLVIAKPQSNLTLVTLTWKTPPAGGS
jgi:anti-sigma factor RsiW